jgi:hypothetical protein
MSKEWAKVPGHKICGSEGKLATVLVPGVGLCTVDGKRVNYPMSEAKRRRVHIPEKWAHLLPPEPEPGVDTNGPGKLDLSGLVSQTQSMQPDHAITETQHRGITVKEKRPVGRRRT